MNCKDMTVYCVSIENGGFSVYFTIEIDVNNGKIRSIAHNSIGFIYEQNNSLYWKTIKYLLFCNFLTDIVCSC